MVLLLPLVLQLPLLAEALDLRLRSLREFTPGGGDWRSTEQAARWEPAGTAVVICDMWNQHWCQGATARVAEMAPRMNEVVSSLRDRGVLIIHCPSETMDFYRDHPGRRLAQSAPKSDLAVIKNACLDRVPAAEPPLPIDDSDGGCDDQPQCPPGMPWRRQIATLEIHDQDAITDNADAFHLMRHRGITNVIVMGVHQNMCVLGRPFAIRQLVSLGQNVVLMRDLTDSMYNSRRRPFVDHFIGNDLVTWHIEKYWCPTITSDQIIGGKPFRFAADSNPPRDYEPPQAATYQGAPSSLRCQEAFEAALGQEWTWLRENPGAWRLRNGGLEIRVEPGDAQGPFIIAATGELPPAPHEQISLQCYHGPPNAEHWIRFDDFRIRQLPE